MPASKFVVRLNPESGSQKHFHGRRKLVLPIAFLSLFGSAFFGCSVKPEENSGVDAYRDQATQIPLGEWVPDDLNPHGDQTDWKILELDDNENLRARLVVADPGTEVLFGLYDVYGQKIRESRKVPSAELAAPVELREFLKSGTYYLRMKAVEGPPTTYSLYADVGTVGNEELVPDDEEALPE